MKYQVWMEGHSIQGQSAKASLLGTYKARTFKSACKKAMVQYNMMSNYNPTKNTYWGCGLYDNEKDARDYFG